MRLTPQILDAMQNCAFKAWQLFKESQTSDNEPDQISTDKISEMAWHLYERQTDVSSTGHDIKSLKSQKLALDLLERTKDLINNDVSPAFFKIPHCSECLYKKECFKKLQERDCISLLSGMTPKVMAKYHRKGITTINQLSYLFRPRRRRNAPHPFMTYIYL